MSQGWQHRFIVVDQNQMRNAGSIAAAILRCRRENLQILIPDGAFFELSKGSQILDTWQASLRLFTDCRELVCVSQKLTELITSEKSGGTAIKNLVSDYGTEFLRTMLHEMANGDFSRIRALLAGLMKTILPQALHAWNNSELHHAMSLRFRDLLKEMLSVDQLKGLRRTPELGIREWLSSAVGAGFAFQGIEHVGKVDHNVAISLAQEPSVLAGFISANAALALYWLAYGGLEAADAKTATNDLHDIEYVVFGGLSVDVLSIDKRLLSIQSAVSEAFAFRKEWFLRALMFGPENA